MKKDISDILNTKILTGPFAGKTFGELTPEENKIIADLHRREAEAHEAAYKAQRSRWGTHMNPDDDELWTPL